MKYFTKYIHVKERIKKGTLCFYGAHIVVCQSDEAGEMWMGQPSIYKPIKLFLCSRDIQVGDKVIGKLADIFNYEELEIVELYKDGAILGKISEKYVAPSSDFFKVIGEVSPEAVWVKEGDEFDEKDIKIWFEVRLQPYYSWEKQNRKDYSKKELKDLENRVMVYIKCSQCNTFH